MKEDLFINEDYLERIDPNGKLDFSYLEQIKPYEGDYRELLRDIDLDAEIAALEKEMNEITLGSVPFQASDVVAVFLAGLVGGACDIILGKPADGYKGMLEKAHEPKIDDDFAFGLGKYLKEYDVKNNPIDKQIPGAPAGDHRLYSYGHDLLRVFKAVSLMLHGTGEVGIHGTGGVLILDTADEKWLEVLEQINIQPGDPMAYLKVLLILALHLYKDFCSARSLPIPGSTLLADLNGHKMPEFVDKLTNEMEYNLRTVTGKLASIFAIEIVIGIYSFLMKLTSKGKQFSDEQHQAKKQKLLLISHSIAMLFNLGKVAVTKNPAFINFAQILRIVKLAWDCCKHEVNQNQKAIEKVNLSVLKTQMEQMQTLVLLDQSLYYTNQIERIIHHKQNEFYEKNQKRRENLANQKESLEALLAQLKSANE